MNNDKRLIEVAFPLKQTSIDSVHEKNVRHGHISTLHIWPARRPLAASRAALIATLLPDPGDKEQREEVLKRLGGVLKKTLKKRKMPNGRVEEIEALETEGGVLRWGREDSPDLEWFRREIRKAYGGRAPRVLDPFSGGGAIPLEALRLGCEVTAIDINPVAWFILKCTLEYPQKLAGKRQRLPDFALQDAEFMSAYLKARGLSSAAISHHLRKVERLRTPLDSSRESQKVARGETLSLLEQTELDADTFDADLAWHVRAWGRWVLTQTRVDLARFYPTYAEYCSLEPYQVVALDTGESLRLVPTNPDGRLQTGLLNAGFDERQLDNPAQPRWVAKPAVAYLWARTVSCKACRAEVPLLKTRWLSKKESKRVALVTTPRADRTGVEFSIDNSVRIQGGNAAQRREFDKKVGQGTMSRAGASCPCCGTIMTMEDLRLEGRAGRMGEVMTAVVVDAPAGKEYRRPTAHEIMMASGSKDELASVFADVPFGVPNEPTPKGGSGAARAFSVDGYGLDSWDKLFLPRQLLALGSLTLITRKANQALVAEGYEPSWAEAVLAYLAIGLDRTADRCSTICRPDPTPTQSGIINTFSRFALPMTWDFAEGAPLLEGSGGYLHSLEWAARYIEHSSWVAEPVRILARSATQQATDGLDVIVTDPPYYDAIPYSDLMDFFYVWLRRVLHGLSEELNDAFAAPLAPKWSHAENDGELIDDSSRFGGDKEASKRNYEDGMARAFSACHSALQPTGRLVIVFAHKHPDAWETLVSAIMKSGFVVDGSWPIQTEMGNRMRSLSSAALSSSVWLVCKKRDPSARAGWDTQVLKEMESAITAKLRDFWDAGIRGPDFIWAATGPAMESYSRYPAVKMASEAGRLMSVAEFLGHVRRIVVDFVVGRVLSRGQSEGVSGDHPLDDVTTYYLLHRNDFGMKDAPAGPCILYAVSCGLSERELADQYEILLRGSSTPDHDGTESDGDDDNDVESAAPSNTGGMYKLKDWRVRKHRLLGMDSPTGRMVPLIDQVHKLMQLWVAGDVVKVNDYLDSRALRRSSVFAQLIQALIEKSRAEGCSEECSILERLQNYLRSVGSTAQAHLGLD